MCCRGCPAGSSEPDASSALQLGFSSCAVREKGPGPTLNPEPYALNPKPIPKLETNLLLLRCSEALRAAVAQAQWCSRRGNA